MSIFSPKPKWHTRKTLRDRIHRSANAADLAAEYPIRWVEETDDAGTLAKAPGFGSRAVWQNHDNSFASAVSLTTIDPYYAHDDVMGALQRSIAQVMMQMEHGEQMQWLWYPWDDASKLFNRFRRIRPDDPPFKKWWITHRSDRDFARMQSGELRCFRSMISLNVAPDRESLLSNPYGIDAGASEAWGAFRKLVELGSILAQNPDGMGPEPYAEMARRTTTRMKAIQQIVGGTGLFRAEPWRAIDLFSFLRRVWATEEWEADGIARGGSHRIPRMDARWAPFASYFMSSAKTLEDNGDMFRFGDYWHRILVMTTLPAKSDVGFIPSALTIPRDVRGIKNMVVAMTARPVEKHFEMEKLRVRLRHLHGQMKGNHEHADNVALIKTCEDRLIELRQATRPQMFNTHLHVHLWEKDRAMLRDREHQVRSALSSVMDMSVDPEDFETLPFVIGYEQPGFPLYPDRERMFPLVPSEVASLAPVSAYSDGCVRTDDTEPIPMMFETDTAVPYGLDIYPGEDRVTNPGGFGVGVPGSGKTNFYQQVILAYANRDADVVVIDGASQPGFQSICKLLGGRYIEFDETFRLNPLATKIVNGLQQNPTADELTEILVTLNAMFRPGARFTPLEASVHTNALRYVFENRSGDGSRVKLPDLRRGLSPDRFPDPVQCGLASEFSLVLEETWLGRYGDMMSGTEELPHSWFTVFDVRSLSDKGKEQLQAVIVSLLFRHLERLSRDNITRVGKDKRSILAIVDEAWKAVRNPAMLPQIIGGYRAGRARALSMHLLSQGMEDVERLLQMNDEGVVTGECESSPILTCSSHVLLFNMAETDAKIAGRAFGLNSAQVEALTKLGGVAGEYREFVHLLKGSDGRQTFTKLRSRVTPEELWATTTSPGTMGIRGEMEQRIKAALTSGSMTRKQLIEELNAAGWDVDATVSDAALGQSVAIHRLAHTPRK